MINKVEELTNYDRFLLAKKESYSNKYVAATTDNNIDNRNYSDYEAYLLGELKRTTPRNAPLMREDEYLVKCTSSAEIARQEKKSSVKFQKYGKIMLAIYVIFVIALAFIVIGGSTTDITSKDMAGAAKISETSASSTDSIGAMTIEEENNEETNWFDKLCDSLSK
ncbi:hypothetical protein EOM82_04975 [bacterium]|nr:hypothetical protein [bacterium]